jgi:hypothetical protein
LAALWLERDDPLLAREALLRLRVDAEDFARGDAAAERDFPLFDPPPPEFAELLLVCLVREAGLLLAIPSPLSFEDILRWRLPALYTQ